jgi:hypothetical protein
LPAAAAAAAAVLPPLAAAVVCSAGYGVPQRDFAKPVWSCVK